MTFYINNPKEESETSLEGNPQDNISINKVKEEASSAYKGSRGIFFLPQRPYMVLGTLRQQLLYPKWIGEELAVTDNVNSVGMSLNLNLVRV